MTFNTLAQPVDLQQVRDLVEDRYNPDEGVVVPVASIGASSTALMLLLIDCKGSLVEGDDVTATFGPRLANDRALPIVYSI